MALDSKKLSLDGPDDWVLWIDQLRSKSQLYNLWQYLNPESKPQGNLATRLRPPREPNITDFSITAQARNRRAQAQEEEGVDTPDLASEASLDIPETIRDLSSADAAIYINQWTEYNNKAKQHEILIKNLATVQTWIQTTVSESLLRSCCTADKPIDVWISNLKDRVGISSVDRLRAAHVQYQQTLTQPLRKRLSTRKEVEDWVTQWDQAIHEAKEAEVAGVTQSAIWFPELISALRQSPICTWADSFEVLKISDADKGTLTPGEVISAIRTHLRATNEVATTKGKIGRGVFGPTTELKSQQEEGPRRGSSSRGRARGRGQDRKRPYEGDQDSRYNQLCEACRGRHPLSRCYYAFPEKRYQGFIPNSILEEAVALKMKGDPDLIDRIRKCKVNDESN